jgi:glucose/arabinose dehydrogenase
MHLRRSILVLISAILLATAGAVHGHAADAKKVDAPGAAMDFGDLMHYFVSIPEPSKQVVNKAIAVRLGDAAICYDMETMRVAACWSGGFLDMGTTNVVRLVQGVGAAPIDGTLQIATRPGPGWADAQGSFTDPRVAGTGTAGFGHLPEAWVHYQGLYRHDHEVVLCYSVGTCAVRELPAATRVGAVTLFTRTIDMGPAAVAERLLIAEVGGAAGGVGRVGESGWSAASGDAAGAQAVLEGGLGGTDHLTLAVVSHAPPGATLQVAEGRVVLTLPARPQAASFQVAVADVPRSALAMTASAAAAAPVPQELALARQGSAIRWPAITTHGRRGADTWAYAVDTIELPQANPWKSWIRPTGVDAFSDGRIAICTLAGDVWIASGIDDGLAAVVWKRFATGLFEPMGLRIVHDQIYVLARDQIIRLEDLQGDGEADHYQSFNNDATVYPKYNDFAFDLQSDRAGNFYYARGGHGAPVGTPLHACLVKVSADGRSSEIYAEGLRAPNGMGMGPHDELSISDNQGNWVPSSRINLVRPGGWYGFVGNPALYKKNEPAIPATQDPPLCWIPMSLDNSSGGEVWAPPGWGPLGGHMLHTSYGMSSLLAVLYETVGGVAQGGVVPLPLHFSSGIMRGRFSPKDGQLYVCGLKGWQTNAGADGCLERVRATRTAACLPVSIAVTAGTLTIGFSSALERSSVVSDNVSIQAYGYHWTSAYGSDDYLASDPKRKGRDRLEVSAVHLSADGRSVSIAIPGLKPVMQMEVTGKFTAADGGPAPLTLANTITVIP